MIAVLYSFGLDGLRPAKAGSMREVNMIEPLREELRPLGIGASDAPVFPNQYGQHRNQRNWPAGSADEPERRRRPGRAMRGEQLSGGRAPVLRAATAGGTVE